jgi:DNA/RNA-binding domain of Phe-tRNA-synthetase-like protein
MPTKRSHDEGEPIFLQISDAWREAYPGAHAGLLVVRNRIHPIGNGALEHRKWALERQLRDRYSGQDRRSLEKHPVLMVYGTHYRRFNKTYHVRLQLESLLLKGKSIPTVTPLVDAMFMAEMDQLLLTAGHDLDVLRLPLRLDVAQGVESYVLLQGGPQSPQAGDMMISDREGIISSIIYGPDQRTRIRAGTINALYTTYAPAGISEQAIEDHMREIRTNVQLAAPESEIALLKVLG